MNPFKGAKVTEDSEEAQKLLNKVVSRLGLEPRALALKGPPNLKELQQIANANPPTEFKSLQAVTSRVFYI